MNRTATFTATATQRATGFALALAVTLMMLGGIDNLATTQHAGTELAKAPQVEPAASQAPSTAAVALVLAPRS